MDDAAREQRIEANKVAVVRVAKVTGNVSLRAVRREGLRLLLQPTKCAGRGFSGQMLRFGSPGRGGTMSDHHPRRVDALEINEAEDGLVIYDPALDMVHHLNPSAAVVFDLCDGTRDPKSIAEVLGDAYELHTPPLDEALAALRDLAERQLIHWDDHSAPD